MVTVARSFTGERHEAHGAFLGAAASAAQRCHRAALTYKINASAANWATEKRAQLKGSNDFKAQAPVSLTVQSPGKWGKKPSVSKIYNENNNLAEREGFEPSMSF
jgi:hypothetical protein